MSLTIVVLSLIVFAFRVKKGIVKREEKILWALWFAHLLIVLPLTIFTREDGTFDSRYLKPIDCLVWGATVWAISSFRYGKRILVVMLGVLVVYNAVMFTKHLVPDSRRHANLVACQWAMRRIQADWRGQSEEDAAAKKFFTIREYTSGGNPSISPISKRMNYFLGARNANPAFRTFGIPDYIVEEDKRLKFKPWDKRDYILLDELQIKKRHYTLYKRRSLSK